MKYFRNERKLSNAKSKLIYPGINGIKEKIYGTQNHKNSFVGSPANNEIVSATFRRANEPANPISAPTRAEELAGDAATKAPSTEYPITPGLEKYHKYLTNPTKVSELFNVNNDNIFNSSAL